MPKRLVTITLSLLDRLRSQIGSLWSIDSEDRLDILLRHQARRWEQGEWIPVEAYRAVVIDLAEEDLLCLISGEIHLRQAAGDTPEGEEYAQRFPEHAETLRRQVEVEIILKSTVLGVSLLDSLPAALEPLVQPVMVPGYDLLSEVSCDELATVYKARRGEKLVALKRFAPGVRLTEVPRLEHPNILPILDVGEHDNQFHLATRYLGGRSLADDLREGKCWTPERTAQLGATLAAALAYAHRRGFVYGAVTPRRILLDERENPFLGDFAQIGPAGKPEADLEGLGSLLLNLLTGGKHLSNTNLCNLNPAVPPQLARILERTQHGAGARPYASMSALEQDLRWYMKPRRFPWLGVLFGMTTMAILALAVFAQCPPATPPRADSGISLRVLSPRLHNRELDFTTPGVFPLRPGDQIRLRSSSSPVTVLWIDGQGHLRELNAHEQERFRLDGAPGLQTLLVLRRRGPLPDGIVPADIVGQLPPPHVDEQQELTVRGWGGDLQPITMDNPHEGPVAFDEALLNAVARLRPHFDHIRVWRFSLRP